MQGTKSTLSGRVCGVLGSSSLPGFDPQLPEGRAPFLPLGLQPPLGNPLQP